MELIYKKDRYVADNSLAISTYVKSEEGWLEPYGKVTVCLVDYGMTPKEGEIFMPTYNMYGEFLSQVMEDIVEEVIRPIQIGYGHGLHVRLKENWEENVKMMEECDG